MPSERRLDTAEHRRGDRPAVAGLHGSCIPGITDPEVRAIVDGRLRECGIEDGDDDDMLRALAQMCVAAIETGLRRERSLSERRRVISALLTAGQPSVVFQPIFDLAGSVVELEALSRFKADPPRSPDLWFADAAEVGLGLDLERAAIRSALDGFHPLLSDRQLRLSFNVSVDMALSGNLKALLAGMPADRITTELTEHDAVGCYSTLNARLAPLRESGVRIAIDDTGAGNAGMQHVLWIEPDVIKLDRVLIQGIDTDPMKQAMVRAVVGFTRMLGSSTVAEGVETVEELSFLRTIQVQAVQGFLLSRPRAPDQLHVLRGRV